MTRVKIVATIGPETNSSQSMQVLRDAGMDVARLNGSHGSREWHAEAIAALRKTVPDVPVLLDIPGRKIRMKNLDHNPTFVAGELLAFATDPTHDGHTRVPITYPDLHEDVRPGNVILADDGALRFTVVSVVDRDVICRAEIPGTLRSGAGVHVPGVSRQGSFVSQRDRQLITFGCQQGVDFIGASFVDCPAHVEAIRAIIGTGKPGIVAKVETQAALECVGDLAACSDALMIDRGDLSAETEGHNVALLQKRILAEAGKASCPVIVATEMLHSMVDSPAPTKAEVSDITNAVLDGAGALMLSEETAVGRFPAEAVAVMRRVADAASRHIQEGLGQESNATDSRVPQAISDAIALICRRLDVTKIVAITISGYAARMVAATMPRQQILAVSNDPAAARGFNLLRGTKGVYVDCPFSRTSLDHIPRCLEALWRRGELTDDDLILVTAVGYPKSGNRMNLIETHRVSDLRDSLGWV